MRNTKASLSARVLTNKAIANILVQLVLSGDWTRYGKTVYLNQRKSIVLYDEAQNVRYSVKRIPC